MSPIPVTAVTQCHSVGISAKAAVPTGALAAAQRRDACCPQMTDRDVLNLGGGRRGNIPEQCTGRATTSADLVWASYLRVRRAGYSGWLSFRINAATATSAVAAAMAGKAVVNPITVTVRRPAFVNPKTVNTTPMNTIGGCTAAVYSDRRRTITTAANTPTVNPIRVPQPRAPTPNRSVSTPTAVNATANSTIGTGRHPVTDRNAAASATAGRRGAPAGTLLIPADNSQIEVWKPSWHGSTAHSAWWAAAAISRC